MGKITSIHDKFIRSIFGDRELAIDYFKDFLPTNVSSQLDFDTLIQISDSYLSKQLQKSMSDIVYSCQLVNSAHHVKVALLIEHKSRVERYTPVQIGNYLFSGYQKQVANKEDLCAIIPILFYHGSQKWDYRTLTELFKIPTEDWKQFIPNFDYIYNDLSGMSDNQLEALSNRFLAASFLAMKHSMDEEWLNENAMSIFRMAVSGSWNQLEQFTVYFFENNAVDESRAVEILDIIPEPLKDNIMNTFDVFARRGMEKGMEQGLEKGRELGLEEGVEKGRDNLIKVLLTNTDFSISKIAELANSSEGVVQKIKEGLDQIR